MVIWRVKKLCDIQKKEGEYIDQRSRNEFECLQRGFKEMADCIGVLNIKKRIGSSQ
jgi:hypothetical protein